MIILKKTNLFLIKKKLVGFVLKESLICTPIRMSY